MAMLNNQRVYIYSIGFQDYTLQWEKHVDKQVLYSVDPRNGGLLSEYSTS